MSKIMERRAAYYKQLYKVELQSLIEILKEQGGCEICGKSISFEGSKVTARVDHCHSTGAIRGIICNRCNQALCMFGDNVEGIYKLLAYLGK